MRWRNLERSSNVEDRRGRTATVAGGVGGLGIIGVILALLLGGGGGGSVGDLSTSSSPPRHRPRARIPGSSMESTTMRRL